MKAKDYFMYKKDGEPTVEGIYRLMTEFVIPGIKTRMSEDAEKKIEALNTQVEDLRRDLRKLEGNFLCLRKNFNVEDERISRRADALLQHLGLKIERVMAPPVDEYQVKDVES